MNEAIRNLVLLVWTFSAVNCNANAQSVTTYTIEEEAAKSAPVVVFGSANLGKNKRDEVLVEQNSQENPLGNPIETTDNAQTVSETEPSADPIPAVVPSKKITEDLPQNPEITKDENPVVVNKEMQDTLYESGGRIYDIQSYPAADIKKIEEPDLNPTITTYPAD